MRAKEKQEGHRERKQRKRDQHRDKKGERKRESTHMALGVTRHFLEMQ